jgi:hypothetical protein
MTCAHTALPCHWQTPTRILPTTLSSLDAASWNCLRDGRPRPLDTAELRECATCVRWEPRTLDSTKRDLVFETWGVGIPLPERRTFDEARRDLVWETWGVRCK